MILLLSAGAYLGYLLSGLYFIRLAEDRFFEAEAPFFKSGRIIKNPRATGRRRLILSAAPGKPGVLGLDATVPFSLGRIRVAYKVAYRPGKTGHRPQALLEIKERGAAEPLTRQQVPAVDLAGGQVALEADLPSSASRLEFWLYFLGPGELSVDHARVQRTGWWTAALWRCLKNPFKAPWAGWHIAKLRNLYHRVGFLALSRRLIAGATGSDQKMIKLYRYVRDRVSAHGGSAGPPWQVLVAGQGLCDTQARVLGELVGSLGVSSRITCDSFQPVSRAGHCGLEVATRKRWAYLDPYLQLMFPGPGGCGLLALAALKKDPSHFKKNARYKALGGKLRRELAVYFKNRASVLRNLRPWAAGKGLLPGMLRRHWARHLQDRYLHLAGRLRRHLARFGLIKARHYHLLGRWEKAQAAYQKACRALEGGKAGRACHYHRAWLLWDQGERQEVCQAWRRLAASKTGKDWPALAKEMAGKMGCP